MLLPHQVIPFLQHDDPDVRAHAARYLAEAHDPSPATADDFWRAIDGFGRAEALPLLARLGELPQTNASVDRLLGALRSKPDEEVDYHLQRDVEWVDFPLLAARRDEILAVEEILPHVRDHLRQRLELADVPADELWERLLRASDEAEGKSFGKFDGLKVDRLVEAMARHGAPAAEKAMARLRDGPGDDWMEVFCVQILGEARHAPAAELLVGRLLIDSDLLLEETVYALARIGTVEVVERLAAFYPGKEWFVRLYADDPLGRIKRPESERALLRLLDVEKDDELNANLAGELCHLCTTEGLELVRRLIVEDRYDPQMADLPQSLLTVGKMVGYEPPEAAEWRAEIERRRKKFQKRGAADLEAMVREMRDRFRRGEPEWPHPDAGDDDEGEFGRDRDEVLDAMDWSGEDYLAPAPLAAPEPIRRDAPKVGRNDPCPCGSGRKYKKCCLTAAEA